MLETKTVIRKNRIIQPKASVLILKQWLNENLYKPYLSSNELLELSKKSNITPEKIQKWFQNQRNILHLTEKRKKVVKIYAKK